MSEVGAPASANGDGSPSIVSRKVGAGIQARLARLQGAAGAPVVTREVPKKFANGYDEPFRERLDGTLRRSLSGTWSVHTLEADTSSASTDGSQTLVDVQPSPSLPTVAEVAELKRRREFTKSWEKQQETVDQLLSPEPSRIQMSPQPIMEEPEAEEEGVLEVKPEFIAKIEPATPIPGQDDPKHGILTPPISEPEATSAPVAKLEPVTTPVRKAQSKTLVRPHTTSTATRLRPSPSSSAGPPQTPTRARPRASAPAASSSSSTLAPPPIPRLRLTPSPPKAASSAPRATQRSQSSMSYRRSSAPARPVAHYSSKVPEKVLPPPVRPRTISKVYEGPTISSLTKQRATVPGTTSRAVSRAGFS